MDTENNWDTTATTSLGEFKRLAEEGDVVAKRVIDKLGKDLLETLDNSTKVLFYINFNDKSKDRIEIKKPIWKNE